MELIQNFNDLSWDEQKTFTLALIQKINETKVFTDETELVLDVIETDEASGDLYVGVYTKDGQDLTVERVAVWTCGTEEDAYEEPDEAEFSESILYDIEKAFKTFNTEIDGYLVNLKIDYAEGETVDVDVKKCTDEDAGVGHYEFWGETGYDSRPYVEVTGVLTQKCWCQATLTISPTY